MYKKEKNPWDRLFIELVLAAAAIVIAVFVTTGWWRIVLALLTGEMTLWAAIDTPPATGIMTTKILEDLGLIVLAWLPGRGLPA